MTTTPTDQPARDHLHRDDHPDTLTLLAALIGHRADHEALGYEPTEHGVWVDWDRLEHGPLATTERATARIAHGLAIIERHGGGLPPRLAHPIHQAVTRIIGPGPDCHDHRTAGLAGLGDPLDRLFDHDLLDQLIGAALDACPPCQHAALDRAQTDPVTTARLVELACLAVTERYGALPPSLTAIASTGLAHPAFRAMARAGANHGPDALATHAHRHSDHERRGALETALDLLTGLL